MERTPKKYKIPILVGGVSAVIGAFWFLGEVAWLTTEPEGWGTIAPFRIVTPILMVLIGLPVFFAGYVWHWWDRG